MISNASLGGAPTTWFANSRAAFASIHIYLIDQFKDIGMGHIV
jgi:hypothetical protein